MLINTKINKHQTETCNKGYTQVKQFNIVTLNYEAKSYKTWKIETRYLFWVLHLLFQLCAFHLQARIVVQQMSNGCNQLG